MPLTITITVPDEKALESFRLEWSKEAGGASVSFFDNESKWMIVNPVIQDGQESATLPCKGGRGAILIHPNQHMEAQNNADQSILGVVVIDLFDHIRNLHKAGVPLHDIAVEAGMSLGELMDIITG